MQKLSTVTTCIFDVDGVFTDSSLLVTDDGRLLRTMNVRDGYAVKRAINAGLHIIVITGGKSIGVQKRLQSLGIEEIHLGIKDKKSCLDEVLAAHDFSTDTLLYMGDDLPDYEAMKMAGIRVCPADAVPEIIEISQFVTAKKGGEGCVREILEKILKIQAKW